MGKRPTTEAADMEEDFFHISSLSSGLEPNWDPLNQLTSTKIGTKTEHKKKTTLLMMLFTATFIYKNKSDNHHN